MLFPGITKVLRRFEFVDALMSLRFDWAVAMAKKVINDRRNSKVQHVYIYIYLQVLLLRIRQLFGIFFKLMHLNT